MSLDLIRISQALEEEEDELSQLFMLEEQMTDRPAQDPWLDSDPWKKNSAFPQPPSVAISTSPPDQRVSALTQNRS